MLSPLIPTAVILSAICQTCGELVVEINDYSPYFIFFFFTSVQIFMYYRKLWLNEKFLNEKSTYSQQIVVTNLEWTRLLPGAFQGDRPV